MLGSADNLHKETKSVALLKTRSVYFEKRLYLETQTWLHFDGDHRGPS